MIESRTAARASLLVVGLCTPHAALGQQPDWPCPNPDPACEETYVRQEWGAVPQNGLNTGTSITISGLACYDTLPHDDYCDMTYEGTWSSEWASRPVSATQNHYVFDPEQPPVFLTHAGSYQPIAGVGDTWVSVTVTLPIPEGSSSYSLPNGTERIFRTRVDQLNGWVMPLVPVEVFWDNGWETTIEQMNHKGPGESGGLPEGFSFAQVVQGQSLVWFYTLTHATKILLCVDGWSPEFACPGTTQDLRIRNENGISLGDLGSTESNVIPFPMTVSEIDAAVPGVYLGVQSPDGAGGITQYLESRTCTDPLPSDCAATEDLHDSDSLDDRIEDVAYMIGSTGAHEVGHAVGLVPFEFQADEGRHSTSPFRSELGELEIMAEHADDTFGFGVIRETDGTRSSLRTVVEWGFVHDRYLNFF